MSIRIVRSHTISFISLLPLSVLPALLGCGSETDESESPDVSAGMVQEETREAYDAAASYAVAKAEALERRAADSLERVDSELDAAREAVQGLSAAARGEVEDAIGRAEQARMNLAKELGAAREAGEAEWRETKSRLSAALDEVEEAEREIGEALSGS